MDIIYSGTVEILYKTGKVDIIKKINYKTII